MNSEKIIDIFIKTYHKDFVWLYYCIKSINKYARNFRRIIVVSDNDGNEIPEIIRNIMPLQVFYTDLPEHIPRNIYQSLGYLWQQVVKMQWADYTDADAALVIDSDELLCEELSSADLLNNDGNFYWFYRDWETVGDAICWKKPTSQVLKIEPRYEAMCISGFVFEKNTTKRLIEYIKKLHNVETLLEIFDNNVNMFSEFNTYGTFIDLIDTDNKIYTKKINIDNYNEYYNSKFIKSWSWGGLKEDDKSNRERIIDMDNDEINKVNIYFGLNLPVKKLDESEKRNDVLNDGQVNLVMIASNRKSIMKMDLRNN
jgi:hypothetical protein